ncbi:hypothetical protein QYF36_022401 [Acer negundo]|nr:hypothetical protein QYF36_022401 [Acer negundo]
MDTSKTKGPGQNKRFWIEEEDNKLIESLSELNNDGRFKAEGSFKPRHLKELEKKLHEKLPRCNLLDTEKKTVTTEKPVWDAYIQSHKDDAHFKLKSFPYYDELSMIFGKDRATGQHAETSADVKEKLQNKGGDYNLDDNASTENVDNVSDNNVDIQFVSKSSKRSQSQIESSSTSKKQRKKSTATLAAVIEKSSARLTKAIGENLNEKRIQLGEELSRTTTLTVIERHKVF